MVRNNKVQLKPLIQWQTEGPLFLMKQMETTNIQCHLVGSVSGHLQTCCGKSLWLQQSKIGNKTIFLYRCLAGFNYQYLILQGIKHPPVKSSSSHWNHQRQLRVLSARQDRTPREQKAARKHGLAPAIPQSEQSDPVTDTREIHWPWIVREMLHNQRTLAAATVSLNFTAYPQELLQQLELWAFKSGLSSFNPQAYNVIWKMSLGTSDYSFYHSMHQKDVHK